MKRITSNVGNNQSSNPEDVISIKKALNAIGLYNGNVSMPYIDAEMDKAIYSLQKIENLKADGLITPGGPTENAMFRLVGSPIVRCPKCGAPHRGSKGRLCPDCHVKQ